MQKVDLFIEKALKKMFEIVGETYSKEFCAKEDWYRKHTWTKEQQETYKKWFICEAKKTFKWDNRTLNWEWAMFHLNYGWKDEISSK